MKKLILLPIVLLVALFGCKPKDSEPADDTNKRKQLVEMFTAESAGYCPNGTRQIYNAISGKENQYVILNYYYGSIYENYTGDTINDFAEEIGVKQLPSMMLNRQEWVTEDDQEDEDGDQLFHPYYFADLTSETSSTATATIKINCTYEPATRTVKAVVSGKRLNEQQSLSLTAIIKESGLHSEQVDYLGTWEGWKDYNHCNVVRHFFTSYKGDTLDFSGNDYTVTFTYDLYYSYIPENCTVVAFLTDNTTGEVLNAEEAPLVPGTTGGLDMKSEGVTAEEVPDTYPEYFTFPAQSANAVYSTAQYYKSEYIVNGHNVAELMMLSVDYSSIEGRLHMPVATFYFIVDDDGNTLPMGTFNFSHTGEVNTAWAGEKNEAQYEYYGSQIHMVTYNNLQNGYLTGYHWLADKGTITITDNTITFSITSLAGSKINGSFAGEIKHLTLDELPARRKAYSPTATMKISKAN